MAGVKSDICMVGGYPRDIGHEKFGCEYDLRTQQDGVNKMKNIGFESDDSLQRYGGEEVPFQLWVEEQRQPKSTVYRETCVGCLASVFEAEDGTSPLSGPTMSASCPVSRRWSRRRASVRVTPSILGRKFSINKVYTKIRYQ